MIHIYEDLFATEVVKNVYAIWNSANMNVAYVTVLEGESVKDKIKKLYLDGDLIPLLRSKTNKNCDFSLRRSKGINNLVLLVSNCCNYACSYCQIEENIPKQNHVHMSLHIAEQALDLFQRNCHPGQMKTITITGGEPLLNVELIKYVVTKAYKITGPVRIVLFTNGSLITTEIAHFLKKNNVQVIVSLDGPEYMHDVMRKNKEGKGTFQTSIEGYHRLKEAGCHVGISSVGGVHNYNKTSELLDFFVQMRPESVGYNISHFLLNNNNPAGITIDEFSNALLVLYEGLRQNGIYLENISRIINSFAYKETRCTECQAQGKGITVDARGKIGPCKSLVINDIFSMKIDPTTIVLETEMFHEWAQRSPLNCSDCVDCPARKMCGGGCAYDSYVQYNGEYMHMDRRICKYHINVLKYLLKDLYIYITPKSNDKTVRFVDDTEQREAFTRFYDPKKLLQHSVGHD